MNADRVAAGRGVNITMWMRGGLAAVGWVAAANRSAIGSVVGVFDVIVGGMRRHESVAKVQEYGCSALGNLAWDSGEWQ